MCSEVFLNLNKVQRQNQRKMYLFTSYLWIKKRHNFIKQVKHILISTASISLKLNKPNFVADCVSCVLPVRGAYKETSLFLIVVIIRV